MPLFGELRRRNIFKVSLAYAIVSWLIVQVADIVLPTFSAPEWVMQVLVLFLLLGFPVAVLFAWAYELTPEGLKPTDEVDKTQSITVQTGRRLNYIVISLLSIAVVFLLIDRYLFPEPEEIIPDTAYRKAIAVLPFVNRSEAEENAEFFADGVHDELLTRLAKVADLKVISRTSVMEYRDTTLNIRQIGEELGVGSILEGGVQRAGDTVRINVQLIDARTDEHVWANTYDRELNAANIFAIQSEISTAIANALEATLSPVEQARLAAVPTESIEALEAFFEGRQALTRRSEQSLLTAIGHFERAIGQDPRFSLAWSGLAEAWLELPNYSPTADPHQVRKESAAASIKAVTLDTDSPNALAVLGWHTLLHNHDWEGAEDAFQSALSVEPTNTNALHWYSHLLSWQGRHDEAIETAELAIESDPLSTLVQTNLNYILMDAQEWDRAFDLGDEILAHDPYTSLMANLWVGYLRAERPVEAAAELRSWAVATARDISAINTLGELIILAMDGDDRALIPDELLALAGISARLPEIYAAIGDAERTIAALQDAHLDGTGARSLLSMRINPSYDFIRDDPRFIELLDDIGLTE